MKAMFFVQTLFFFFLFQLCLLNEATVPGYETIAGTLPQCVLCFACTCTVLPVDKADATADVQ